MSEDLKPPKPVESEREYLDRVRENDRRWNWWSAWGKAWTGIGERESGVKAWSQPICRRCRQVMTRDHQCS